jgi:hypothetical protein
MTEGQLLEVHDESAHLVVLLLEKVIGAAHEGASDVPNAKLLPDSRGLPKASGDGARVTSVTSAVTLRGPGA